MTQTMTTSELKSNMWVMWRGTQSRIDRVERISDLSYTVTLTRYNMCGTEIGRLSVGSAGDNVWTVVPNPNKR